MKKVFVVIVALCAIYSLSFGQKAGKKAEKAAETKVAIKSSVDSISYSYGMDIGKYFRDLDKMGVKINIELLSQGMNDYSKKGKTLLTLDEVTKILNRFSQEMQAKQKEIMDKTKNEQADKNIKEGTKFLADNKTKAGVIETKSGLQYRIITEGKGKKPTLSDIVTVNYAGRTIDGQEFDSSYKRGQPATFPLSGIIEGWKEALQLMPEGSKWQIYIPSNLAYGEAGAGQAVGPHATLIFDIELIKIGN
jgi:FKBP-type peptidyl-prolyl cis-trans isomerase FklB